MSEQERRILFLNVSRTLVQYFPEMYNERRPQGTFSNNYTVEGVESIARLQPDLLLLDIEHEEQTGVWQRLQQLKMHQATANIPILLCVGARQSLPWSPDYFYQLGVWLITKPFTRDEILEVIGQIPLPSPY